MDKIKNAVYRITDLENDDRPRERLIKIGPQALKDAELIAILLRVGVRGENSVQVAERLLRDLGGLSGLQRAPAGLISTQRGIGEAKAAQILAAIELGRRIATFNAGDREPVVHSPKDVADLVMYEMSGLVQEELWVLLLDTRNRKISLEKIYKGSLNNSLIRVAEVFKPAVQCNAASIVIMHNHPSGDSSPSQEDIAITREIVKAGELLGVDVLDHLVIGQGNFVSLKESGVGFSGK